MEQVNTVTDLGFTSTGRHLYHLKVTGLDLTSGACEISLPTDQIQAIIPTSSSVENTDDYVRSHNFTVSGNVLTITVKEMQASATNTWGDAVTDDVSASVYDVLIVGL